MAIEIKRGSEHFCFSNRIDPFQIKPMVNSIDVESIQSEWETMLYQTLSDVENSKGYMRIADVFPNIKDEFVLGYGWQF